MSCPARRPVPKRGCRVNLFRRGGVRTLRFWTGQVLFAYATCHLLNHAFGIRSIEAMKTAGAILLTPWQSTPGATLLYTALLVHAGLGLHSFWRRRHLRIPAVELAQLFLGLAVPLLLIAHAGAIRYAEIVYRMDVGFDRVLYQLWVAVPTTGLPRQFLLMLVVWIHGCIGMRAWLRTKPWYGRAVPALTSMATLVIVLSLLGFINAGLDMRALAEVHPAAIPHYQVGVAGATTDEALAAVNRFTDGLTVAYLLLLGGVIAARAAREWHAARFRSIRLTYPGGRVVTVPIGFSVLEASRWASIPHASVCGGRGRCSTCRVDVVAGQEGLPPPAPEERRLLDRIGAPESVRLACQLRPDHDIAVVPLVSAEASPREQVRDLGLPAGGRREAQVAALFVDLRQSTRLSDDRLPYDALFIVERYINTVSAAIRDWDGEVTNVAGDGIMSVFGARGSDPRFARDAFRAAHAIWEGMDALNRELERELSEPLRFGIGLHVGPAVVGLRWDGGMDGMPFLGDTGNVAARLEAQTKQFDCVMVASRDAVRMVAGGPRLPEFATVMLPGKQEPILAARFAARDELEFTIGLVQTEADTRA